MMKTLLDAGEHNIKSGVIEFVASGKRQMKFVLRDDYQVLPCTAKDPRRARQVTRLREDGSAENGSRSIATR